MRLNRMCPLCFIKNIFTNKEKCNQIVDQPYDNGITKPPMGWSSWNCFRNKIDEDCIYTIGDCMVKSGLLEAGYQYLNLDDCWHSSMRDENDRLQGDFGTFPSGILSLVKKLNGLGLKVGIYTSNGTLTCEDLPASLGREALDADTIASWGIEYFKYDYCHHKKISPYAPLIATVSLANKGEKDSIVLSAAAANLEGNAHAFKDKHMPTGTYVSGLDRNSGTITFENIHLEKGGEYTLTLTTKKVGFYEKFAMISVNSEKPQSITVPSCMPMNYTARTQMKVTLKKGVNTIKIFNPIYDRTASAKLQYQNMGQKLKEASLRRAKENKTEVKPIVYSICEWGFNKPWIWGASAGNIWRTTMDIRPWWIWIMFIYRKTVQLNDFSSKGAFNDPDMLEVGNGKLTIDENRAHFSLWCMMNAPLILGNDLRKLINADGSIDKENPVLKIATNKKLIALNQDDLCKAAKLVKKGFIDVLAKPLTDGIAICILNHTNRPKKYAYNIKQLIKDAYIKLPEQNSYTLENLWDDSLLSTTDIVNADLAAHGVAVYKIKHSSI
ncbi:MAG: alpha-galactosidase [Clostridia bacterium]|nr:alpha-galactosidase [Clostridia bacterium]